MNREELIEEAAKAIARSRGDFLDGEQDRISARAALAVFEKAQAPTTNYVDIVFDGPPEADAGQFVEVEDATGASVKFGEWVEREDGYWVLRIPASQTPTYGERGALLIAPRETWGWDTCVVCGSKEVSDRGMVIMGASDGAPYVARIAWCDQSQECREDLRQTSFLLTEFDANMIDQGATK